MLLCRDNTSISTVHLKRIANVHNHDDKQILTRRLSLLMFLFHDDIFLKESVIALD